MARLTATNGNVTTAAGLLSNVPAAAFTVAAVFNRAGTTTDGYENILALETAGNQVITNIGASAAAAPYELRFGQGGTTRTFGFNNLANNDIYLYLVRKTTGTVTPRANLYRFSAGVPAWDGWANGNGTVDNRPSDTIARGRILNQQGGFPLNGGVWVAAWWNVALAEADIVHASNGLHIGVQKWLDINAGVGLCALWRPGETNPVQDESTSGTSDETARSGVTITAGDPPGFNMQFGSVPADGELLAALGLAPALAGARASQGALATVIDLAPALAGARAGAGTLAGALGIAPAIAAARASGGVLAGALDLAPALAGERASGGVLAGALGLAPALAGARASGGMLAGGIDLTPALATSDQHTGQLFSTINIAPALAGARASRGALAGAVHLAPGLVAVRSSLGTLNTPLAISPALHGSDGQAGRPVHPYLFPDGPVSGFPWVTRPVKSFQEVTE